MANEQTLILLKPDAVSRGLIGDVIRRYESKGLRIVAMKMLHVTPELARKHYDEHLEKPFYPDLERYITTGRIVAMVLEGESAIMVTRKINGKTKLPDMEPGTVRGDYARSTTANLVHGSDSPERAQYEIANFFTSDEIIESESDPDII